MIQKLILLYQQIKESSSRWSSKILNLFSNVWHEKPTEDMSSSVLSKEKIDDKIYHFFDELNTLVNVDVENRAFDAGNLRVQIEYLQKKPELTKVQHVALKRLQKETHAIEQNKEITVKMDKGSIFALKEKLQPRLDGPDSDEDPNDLSFGHDGR